MELKDFVKRTLVEIVEGIREASAAIAKDDGALVAPLLNTPNGTAFSVRNENGGGLAYPVEFDLAVTVTEGQEAKHGASGKLTIASVLSAGGAMSEASTEAKTAVQRIKFMVPLRYPNGQLPPSGRTGRGEEAPIDWRSA